MRRTAFVITLLWLADYAAADAPVSITLITFNGRPATGLSNIPTPIRTQTLNLDALHNMYVTLTHGLPIGQRVAPGDLDNIVTTIKQRVAEIAPSDRNSAYQAQIQAQRWAIRHVPAMVFNDGEAVMYGITDFGEALDRWHAAGGVR